MSNQNLLRNTKHTLESLQTSGTVKKKTTQEACVFWCAGVGKAPQVHVILIPSTCCVKQERERETVSWVLTGHMDSTVLSWCGAIFAQN